MKPVLQRVELEIERSWAAAHLELLEPAVRKFMEEHVGAKLTVEKLDEHRLQVVAVYPEKEIDQST